jgi:dihydrofolate synthase/folylpolyglutamate synthase
MLRAEFDDFLLRITERGMRKGLDGMHEALERLGHPERAYPIIHVAGTNGKGSTCTFTAQLLKAAGQKVGLTLSPHVNDYRERVQVDGQLIPEADLLALHSELIKHLPDNLGLTYFEWTTLLALSYFRAQKVDYAILETGMGGRWDATNACPAILTGITTIGLDHTVILGDTLDKILREKLAIIKEAPDCLFGPQEKALIEIAKEECAQKPTRLTLMSEWQDIQHDLCMQIPQANSLTSYLKDNLSFALSLICLLHKQGRLPHPQTFLSHVKLSPPPARLAYFPGPPPILIDAAHNHDGLLALKAEVTRRFGDAYTLIFGCLNDRNFAELAGLICSKSQNYWARLEAGHRSTPETTYTHITQLYGGETIDLNESFINNQWLATQINPIVVCGSFSLCGPFLNMWRSYAQKSF